MIIYWFLSVIFKKVIETKLVENYITCQKEKNKMIKMQQNLHAIYARVPDDWLRKIKQSLLAKFFFSKLHFNPCQKI